MLRLTILFGVFLCTLNIKIHLYNEPVIDENLLANYNVSQIEQIYFHQCTLTLNDVIKIFGEQQFPKLRNITLEKAQITPIMLKQFLKIKAPELVQLSLFYNPIGDEGFEILMNSSLVKQIQYLTLPRIEITSKGFEKLVSVQLPKLINISFAHNELQAEGFRHFSSWKLPNLRMLNIMMTGFNDKGAEYLSTMNLNSAQLGLHGLDLISRINMPNLHQLDIESQDLNLGAVKVLSKINLTQIQVFMCGSCNIEDKSEFWRLDMPLIQRLELPSSKIDKKLSHILKNKPKLKSLNLFNNMIRNFDFAADLPQLLEDLVLSNNMLKGDNISLLHRLKNLKLLRLSSNDLDDNDYSELFNNATFRLQQLQLKRSAIAEKGFEALGKIDLSQLKTLDLSDGSFGKKIQSMGKNLNFPKLKALKLSQCRLDDESLIYIINEWNMPQLQQFHIRANYFTDATIKQMVKLNLTNIKQLTLDTSKLTVTGIGFQSWSMSLLLNIQSIALNHNKLSIEGIKAFMKINLSNIFSMQIRNCNITNQGLKLLKTQNYSHLSHLFMGENSYDDEGIIDFFTSHTFKNLTVFDMSKTYVGNKGVQLISHAHPFFKVFGLSSTLITSNFPQECNPDFFKRLQIFELSVNQLKDKFFTSLGKVQTNLERLTLLLIPKNQFTDKGVEQMCKINFPHLVFANFQGSEITLKSRNTICQRNYPHLRYFLVTFYDFDQNIELSECSQKLHFG